MFYVDMLIYRSISHRNPGKNAQILQCSDDRKDDRGSLPDVFLDLCSCCPGHGGDTTGNVPGSFLCCHGGSVLSSAE